MTALSGSRQPTEKLGDGQWIGHIRKRLHLLDDAGRKRRRWHAVRSFDVTDLMRRSDVTILHQER